MADERPAVETGLSRELTLFHITMMGVGMMIGAGVFIGTGASLRHAGPGGMLLTFAFNGVVALITAMAYAELASALPRAGGAYHYTRVGFGKGVSFLAGWMEWFASSVAGSLYAVTFATYVVHFVQQMGWVEADPRLDWLWVKAIAVVVGLLFIYVNYRGVSETGKAGALITLGQTATLVFVALVGYVVAHREPERLANFQPFMPKGWHALVFTMGAAYVAFEGFEVIAQTGDEAIEPRRNLPKAMLYSILIVVTTYVAVAAAVVISVKPGDVIEGQKVGVVWQWLGGQGENGSLAFAHAVKHLMPTAGFGNLLCVLAVIFSSTSALNATVYSATRVSYALGRDGMLPAAFASISPTRRVPHVALIATSVLMLTVAVILPVRGVAASASAMFLLLFLLVNVCVIKVRRQLGDELRYGFVMPLFPVLPILAIVLQTVMAAGLAKLSTTAWVSCGTWLAICGVVYYGYSRHHAKEPDESIITFEEERAPESRPLSILLPVANPQNALTLIKPTVVLARARDAEVDVLHMVPIPAQAPLSDAPKYMAEGEEALVEVLLYASVNFPTHRTIQYCRNVARGVLSAARQRNTSMILLGWRGQSFRKDFILGSTVDPILERAPCDVVVVRDWPKGKIKSVLVPVAGGPHTRLALEVAALFAKEDGGRVTPFNVSRSDQAMADARELLDAAVDAVGQPPELFEPKFVQAENVLEAILAEAPAHDLVVIGASQERVWQRMVMGSIPEELVVRCDKPVAMVKAKAPIRSWIRRWI